MSRRSRKPPESSKFERNSPATEAACSPQTTAEKTETGPQHGRVHVAVITLIVTLCAGLYAWTADFPMVFDDEMYMKNNAIFKDAGSFSYPVRFAEFATLPGKIGADPDLATNFIMRPIAYATLHLNYMLDGFNPRWYRIVNIIVHALGSILIYALLRLLFRRSPAAGALPSGSAVFISATAALLFAAHPLATESVTYIIQRFTSLSTLFYLLTLWLYFYSLQAASRPVRVTLCTLSVIALVLGMQTKECVFTAPLMAVLIDRVVNGTLLGMAARRAWPLLLCLPIIPALVILTSMAQHGGGLDLGAALNIVNSRDKPLSHWHYLLTQFTVLTAYLQRIFWPAGLNLDPEWPLYRSLLAAPVLKALTVLSAFIAGAWWAWRRHPDSMLARLAWVFTLWFFVTVSISSGVVPLPDLMADHRTYLPSIGIFALVACLLDRMRTSQWQPAVSRAAIPAGVLVAIAALAWATYSRNEVWRSLENLWTDTAAKSPGKFRVWGNLGAAYSTAGKEEEAIKCYETALKIEPRFQNAMFNLSNSLLRLGRPKESLDTSFKLIQMDKRTATQPHVVYTVGLGLAGVGRYDEAINVFNEILAVMPDDILCHRAMGTVYMQTNRPAQALAHLQKAAKLKAPDESLLNHIKLAEAALAASPQSQPFRLQSSQTQPFRLQ